MASEEHVEIVKQGAKAIAEWRAKHPSERLDLWMADVIGADLIAADLRLANLSEADFAGAA